MTFGERMKIGMVIAGVRSGEIRRDLGINDADISAYCTGRNVPREARRQVILEYLENRRKGTLRALDVLEGMGL